MFFLTLHISCLYVILSLPGFGNFPGRGHIKCRGQIIVGNQLKIIIWCNITCVRDHICFIREDGGLNFIPWRFLFIKDTLNFILCLNVDTKGHIWNNNWYLKFFCKWCRNSCYLANIGQLCFNTLNFKVALYLLLHYNLVGVVRFYYVFFLSYQYNAISLLNCHCTMHPPPRLKIKGHQKFARKIGYLILNVLWISNYQ